MQFRPLGSSDLNVSAIGLGAMPMSVRSDRPSQSDATRVIHRALDLGVTLIDTADCYCLDDTEMGHNERLIGAALAELPVSRRQRVVVATKGGLVRPDGRWERCGRPDHLRNACEQSLRNLRTDCITLYQYHAPDPAVPLTESMGELNKLQEEGKIRHIGVSNFSAGELDAAMKIVRIVSIQNRYAPTHRRPERDGTLHAARHHNLAFLPWSPLGGMSSAKSLGRDRAVVGRIAMAHNATPQRIALAWLLGKGPHIIPIPGASQTKTLEDSVKAADLTLSEDELTQLDRAWS